MEVGASRGPSLGVNRSAGEFHILAEANRHRDFFDLAGRQRGSSAWHRKPSSLAVITAWTSFFTMDVVRILTCESAGSGSRMSASDPVRCPSASSSVPGALSVKNPRAASCVIVPGPIDPGLVGFLIHLDTAGGCDPLGILSLPSHAGRRQRTGKRSFFSRVALIDVGDRLLVPRLSR